MLHDAAVASTIVHSHHGWCQQGACLSGGPLHREVPGAALVLLNTLLSGHATAQCCIRRASGGQPAALRLPLQVSFCMWDIREAKDEVF